MRIYTVDSRSVGLILTRDDGTYWQAVKGEWSAPFSSDLHLSLFVSRDKAPSPMADLQSVDVGDVMEQYPDAQVLYAFVDSTNGHTIKLEAVWAAQALAPYPTQTVYLVVGSQAKVKS